MSPTGTKGPLLYTPPPTNLTSADQIPPPPLHWFPALHLPPNRARFNAQLKGAAQGEGREEQCLGREARRRHHHRCNFVRAHSAARLIDGHEAQDVVLPHLPVHPIFRHQVTNCLCLSPCLVGPLGPDMIRCRWGWDLPLLLLLGDRRSGWGCHGFILSRFQFWLFHSITVGCLVRFYWIPQL